MSHIEHDQRRNVVMMRGRRRTLHACDSRYKTFVLGDMRRLNGLLISRPGERGCIGDEGNVSGVLDDARDGETGRCCGMLMFMVGDNVVVGRRTSPTTIRQWIMPKLSSSWR